MCTRVYWDVDARAREIRARARAIAMKKGRPRARADFPASDVLVRGTIVSFTGRGIVEL